MIPKSTLSRRSRTVQGENASPGSTTRRRSSTTLDSHDHRDEDDTHGDAEGQPWLRQFRIESGGVQADDVEQSARHDEAGQEHHQECAEEPGHLDLRSRGEP